MIKYYKVFVSKNIRIIMLLITLVLVIFPAVVELLTGTYPLVGIIVALTFFTIAKLMEDFFCFGGIAVKNQKIMEYCRSSIKGYEVVKKGLICDAAITFATTLAISVVGMFLTVAINDGIENFQFWTVLFMIALAATATALIHLSEIVSRKFCKALTTHMLIAYFVTSLASLAYVPTIMYFTQGLSAAAVICLIASIAVAVLVSVLIVIEGINGYKSGFYDK